MTLPFVVRNIDILGVYDWRLALQLVADQGMWLESLPGARVCILFTPWTCFYPVVYDIFLHYTTWLRYESFEAKQTRSQSLIGSAVPHDLLSPPLDRCSRQGYRCF